MEPREAAARLREQGELLRKFALQVEQTTAHTAESQALFNLLSVILNCYGDFKSSQADLLTALSSVAYFRLELIDDGQGGSTFSLEKAIEGRPISKPPFDAEFWNQLRDL
jgi:hypothetical protein